MLEVFEHKLEVMLEVLKYTLEVILYKADSNYLYILNRLIKYFIFATATEVMLLL